MKKKWKWLAGSTALLLLAVLLAVPFAALKEAQAFTEGYEITGENALQFPVKQKKASSSATVKYQTVSWYLFKEFLGGDKNEGYKTATADMWGQNGFKVSASRVDRTEPDSSGIFWDTMQMDAASFLTALKTLYTRDELLNSNGITLYASRVLRKVNAGGTQTGGPYYNYNSFSDGATWSEGTLDAVEKGYNIPVSVILSTADFNVRYVAVDENGTESEVPFVTGFTFGGAKAGSDIVEGRVLYGESLTFGSTSYTGKEYTYKGFRWTSQDGSSIKSGTPSSVTVDRSVAPNGILELTFYFEKKPEPTQIPFVSPTAAPTQVPGATAAPTPKPTAVPTPTTVPVVSGMFENIYEHYYTTDAGYWIGKLADSITDKLAKYDSSTGSGTLAESDYTKRDLGYSQGTDASGNVWYFIPDGTNARFVHPKTYNGYAVDSAEVKHITELIFPSSITAGGTTYTVTHIGGGTAKYKEEEPTGSYGTYVNVSSGYGPDRGEYYYDYLSGSSYPITARWTSVSYKYGVLGNGEIVSEGGNSVTGEEECSRKKYGNSYYFYNTTLKSITVPSTVTEIANGAFIYCQALETIRGGAGITTINAYAFEADPYPYAMLSRTWTESGISCYGYYYYNDSFSTSAETAVMTAWKQNSVLGGELVFPVLPKLATLGTGAFKNHHNIREVDLSDTIAAIGREAFSGCGLDHIRIPNASCSIYDGESTLGTKGAVEELTAIHTVPDSTALNYGLKYNAFYRLFCGYPVTYEPNGGSGSAVELLSALNVDFMKNPRYLDYNNFKSSGSYDYSSNSCQYASYLDENGVLWKLDKTNKKALVVASGTTFTELFTEGDGTAHFAWDTEGNLWFSGQQRYRYVDDEDSWYDSYSSMYEWKKLTLPADAVKVVCTDMSVFTLTAEGIVYKTYMATTFNKAINASGPYFTDFMVGAYNGGTDVENNTILYGMDSSNTLWKTKQGGYAGFNLSYWSSLAASDFVTDSLISGTAVRTMDFETDSGHTYYYFITSDGTLTVTNGSRSKNLSGCGFTGMEKVPGGGMLLKDASGNTYYAFSCYSSGLVVNLYKVASSGVSVKQMWRGSCQYIVNRAYGSNSWSDLGTDAVSADRLYVWTSDGYLSAVPLSAELATGDSTSHDGSSVWRMASVPFQKVLFDGDHFYALAEDGTLWSAGVNYFGELGNPSRETSFGYQYPEAGAWKYLTQTGSRTYVDIYTEHPVYQVYSTARYQSRYALAQGTDGRVYLAGRGSSYDGTGFSDEVNDFVATENSIWPASENYVRGYDYDTEIAYGLFDRTGYDFTGWNTAADGRGTAYQPGTCVELESALTLYAQWGVKNKNIIFHANGGSGYMEPVSFAFSQTSAKLTKNIFERTGYDFAGWNTAADGSGTFHADEATVTGITGDLILYAQWNKKTVNYTLVYMTYPFGSLSNTAWKTKSLSYETEEIVEGAPYTASGCTVSYAANKSAAMSTTPVVAALTAANTSTKAPDFESWLLYKSAGSSPVYRGRSYEKGQTISRLTQTGGDIFYLYPSWGGENAGVLLPEASCGGYAFVGWSESADGTGPRYTVGESDEGGIYTPGKNTTLYAVWEPKTYEITLDGQGADSQSQTGVTMTFDASCPDVSVPVRSRYLFMGYFTGTNGTGTQYYDKEGNGLLKWQISDGSVSTLYAYWKIKEYDIVLIDRGATSTNHTESVQLSYNEKGMDIIPPEKVGYTFQGYYTAIRGSGTKYYDSKGTCIKNWVEEEQKHLYAYWIQDEIAAPDIEDKIEPVLPEEQECQGIVKNENAKGLLYADDYNVTTGSLNDLQPYLAYDTKFSEGAIPGTEKLSFRAKLSSWVLRYKFCRRTGIDYVRYYVTVQYKTQYERFEDEELVISEQQRKTFQFLVPKVWSYWEVVEHGVYYPEKVLVTNSALKEEQLEVPVESEAGKAESLPVCEIIRYGEKKNHVIWDEFDLDGYPIVRIELPQEQYIISNLPDVLPDTETYLTVVCENAAWNDERYAEVRNDFYAINEKIILNDMITQNGMGSEAREELLFGYSDVIEVTSYSQTYVSGIELDERKENGRYNTIAETIYRGNSENINTPCEMKLPIENVNEVNIHTPIACKGVVVDGISEGIINLCEEWNAFTLRIDNIGIHRKSPGYGLKDFRFALSGKCNIAYSDGIYMNQVQLPFDVYLNSGNVSEMSEKEDISFQRIKLAAGTWITIGDRDITFYVSDMQEEGRYIVNFRSIAVNCPTDDEGKYITSGKEQNKANVNEINYVATDNMVLEMKSNSQQFQITDTNDPSAARVLQSGFQALTLKKGYGFSYEFVYKEYVYGEQSDVEIEPRYFWISEDGKERQEVILYQKVNIPEKEWRDNNSIHKWCGSVTIPADVLCVAADFPLEEYVKKQIITGKELFFKKTGFLMIQFEIRIKKGQETVYVFSDWSSTKLANDAVKAGWNYVSGDVIRYDLSQSISDDYEVGGVE